ncbi:glycosyltransferase family 2 protein [Hyphococcus sp.]|uniref:glycosyltransferase family 2 protein n=1 Tax=Hyphococcus sp. TaxID=2038636 RepID=UPI003CCBDB2E
MDTVFVILSAGLAVAALFLAAFLFVEVIASLPRPANAARRALTGKIAVIIPAHNESSVIGATLSNIQQQLSDGDRLIVVADNCNDDTAEIARRAGAQAAERTDADKRGKGYALQFGIDMLRAAPPDIVVLADADCMFEEGALRNIAAMAEQRDRPVQALYLMKAPIGASPRLQAAEFVWGFINHTRMLGLQRLFDVTRFTGSGFAIPWRHIEKVPLASAEIVEDLSLTFDLTRAGAAPVLAPLQIVESDFPVGERALARQAARWSLGSLRYSAKSGLSLIVEGVKSSNSRLVGAAIDLLIPPLTIFIGLQGAIALLALGVWLFTGVSWPFAVVWWSLALTASAVVIGWARHGRDALPPSSLGGLVAFLAAKANVFGRSGRESAKNWTPTRGGDDAGNGA